MNILIVDDDRSMRLVIEKLVENTGNHNILLCESLEDAERLISKFKIDGALLDLVLNGATGIDVAKLCKEKNIPVVFCTSTVDSYNMKMMYGYGWIISKPCTEAAINRAVAYFTTK